MLAPRIIPCLDVDNGRVVKGIQFKNIRDAGDPVILARNYNDQGADEITFLDIGASFKKRAILLEKVEQVSRQVFVPLTVGGGIRNLNDIQKILQAGADKVAVCSAAIKNPRLLSEGARRFGSQCMVLSVDANKNKNSWDAYLHGGRINSGLDALKWIEQGESLGAGEILLNSINRDGTRDGYDLELIRRVSKEVNIPVIASGGAGTLEHLLQAITRGGADAILLASLLHSGEYRIQEIKHYLKQKGVEVRC